MKRIIIMFLVLCGVSQVHAYKMGIYTLNYLTRLFFYNAESSGMMIKDALTEEQKVIFIDKLIEFRATKAPSIHSCSLPEVITYLNLVKENLETQDKLIGNAAYEFYRYLCRQRYRFFFNQSSCFIQHFYDENVTASLAEDLLLKRHIKQLDRFQYEHCNPYICFINNIENDKIKVFNEYENELKRQSEAALDFIHRDENFCSLVKKLFVTMRSSLVIQIPTTTATTNVTCSSSVCVLL